MKHTALIVTAGSGSSAYFGAQFLLPALRHTAGLCCGAVKEVHESEVMAALDALEEDATALLLDASMPLVTEADARALLSARCARVPGREFPRAYAKGVAEQAVDLSQESLSVVKDPETLAFALSVLRARKNVELMRANVILLCPEQTYIDMDVTIGAGTVIHPGCTLTGGTVVGENCLLLSGCRLHACAIGNDVRMESSVLTECSVAKGTTIGPFAYLRPGTKVGEDCRIGDFVEIKNSVIGDETRISHLTYVGDSDLGKDINLGCGVVFVNYDGKKKHRSTVGDSAFIGCNVNLVSPVHIGPGAYVAAGSTVTEDVPGGALAIGRARQTTKEGWVEQRKREGKL